MSGDAEALADLQRWSKPGCVVYQTIWVRNFTNPNRSGWGVYERGADGPCLLRPPCTEDEVKAFMAQRGYARRQGR